MATDIFSLREKDKRLPIEQQDIPPDADSQWAIDYEAIHGYTPTSYDRDRRDWSIRFASQYGRTPERADWERNYYKEQTPKEKAIGAGKPEFVARPTSGVDRSRTGELIVPFPWQADESGAETDMTARFRQYDRWDSQRGQYARGTPEWNTLTTAMNQLQTPTAPWYFSFAKKFGLRDEVLQIAGNRTGQDRVQAIANWIRQKQAQGVDPFNQADPYSAAYKAQATQAAQTAQVTQPTSMTTETQRQPGGAFVLEAGQPENVPPYRPAEYGPVGSQPRPEFVWDPQRGRYVPREQLAPSPTIPEEGPIGAERFLPTGPVTTGTGPSLGTPAPIRFPELEATQPPPAIDTRPEFLRRLQRQREADTTLQSAGVPGGRTSLFGEGPVPVAGPRPIAGTPKAERLRWDPNVTMVLDRAVNDWRLLRDARDPDMSTAYPIQVIQSKDALSSWNNFLQSAINAGR